MIVCRITSKLYNSVFDIELTDWKRCGLKLPSVIRVHKIASIEKAMIDIKLGEGGASVKFQVQELLRRITYL